MFIQRDRIGAAACTMLALLLVFGLWVTTSTDGGQMLAQGAPRLLL